MQSHLDASGRRSIERAHRERYAARTGGHVHACRHAHRRGIRRHHRNRFVSGDRLTEADCNRSFFADCDGLILRTDADVVVDDRDDACRVCDGGAGAGRGDGHVERFIRFDVRVARDRNRECFAGLVRERECRRRRDVIAAGARGAVRCRDVDIAAERGSCAHGHEYVLRSAVSFNDAYIVDAQFRFRIVIEDRACIGRAALRARLGRELHGELFVRLVSNVAVHEHLDRLLRLARRERDAAGRVQEIDRRLRRARN